jgi:hypothetical protein
MIALRFQLNGEAAITAGLPGRHTVSAIGMVGRDSLASRAYVGGMRKPSPNERISVKWFERPLKVGDRIRVEVVESSEDDISPSQEPDMAAVTEKAERAKLRALFEKYGPARDPGDRP